MTYENTEKKGMGRTQRRLMGAVLTAVVIAVVIAFNVVVFAITDIFGLYLYSPEDESAPISGNTDSLFSEAIDRGQKVTVTFCMPEDEVKVHDTGSFVYTTATALAEKYSDFITLKYVNIYTRLDQDGNRADLTKFSKDMRGVDTAINATSVLFESGENYRVLTDTSTSAGFAHFYTLDAEGYVYAYNGEEIMSAMIAWVLNDRHETAYLTMNHGETADMSFSSILTCAGYYVDVINLRKTEVPEDAALLVISNPTSDFEKGAKGSGVRAERVRAEIERIQSYLDRGGDLYVSLDPYAKQLPVLEGFLAEYGFSMTGVTAENGSFSRNIVRDSVDAITTDGLAFVATYAEDNILAADINSRMKQYGSGRVLMNEVARLTLSGTAEPLLVSSSSSSTVAAGTVTDDGGGYAVAGYNYIDRGAEKEGSYIFVVPSTFLTSSEATVTNGYSNKDFVYATLETLFDSNAAPYGCNNIMYTTSILEGFTQGTARVFTAILMAIPVAIGIVGAVIIIRRKNR